MMMYEIRIYGRPKTHMPTTKQVTSFLVLYYPVLTAHPGGGKML